MSTEKQQTFSSTKDLARTLGKKELMGIAIGQIIGAGIMSMMGVAIAMTGRSANLAFMLSAMFTMCTFFPSIFITSCIRMRGGMYTQFAIFAGDKWAGYYSVVYFITNMSLAMYALSFAQYALALLPTGGSQKVIALRRTPITSSRSTPAMRSRRSPVRSTRWFAAFRVQTVDFSLTSIWKRGLKMEEYD